MATRPWVTPAEVKAYSDFSSVQNRDDSKLAIDISRAETYVIAYTHHSFSDAEKYPDIPESVKTAVILIAEMYAYNATNGKGGAFKSESFDDYSYTLADTESKLDNLLLGPLLDGFVEGGAVAGRDVVMRMRKL